MLSEDLISLNQEIQYCVLEKESLSETNHLLRQDLVCSIYMHMS